MTHFIPKIKSTKPITAKTNITIPIELMAILIAGDTLDEIWVLSTACCEILIEFSSVKLVAVVTPKNKEPKATNTQQILSIKMAIDVILRIVFDFFI